MMEMVYKLEGDAYEITNARQVYLSKDVARESAKEWADFLGVDDIQEAFDADEIRIVEMKVIN